MTNTTKKTYTDLKREHKTNLQAFYKERLDASFKIYSEFEIPLANDEFSPLPFQRAGVEYMATAPKDQRRFMVSDPPGVGKTIQSILFCNLIGAYLGRIIIICPTSVLDNWNRELSRWLIGYTESDVFILQGLSKMPTTEKVIITTYKTVSYKGVIAALCYGYEVEGIVNPFNVLILDECQALKNPKAHRTKMILGELGLSDRADHTLFVSGTNVLNRPIELYPSINAMNPKAIGFRSLHEYGKYFCAGFRPKNQQNWNYDGASNVDELGQRLRVYGMFRRKKSEILPQLPEITTSIIRLNADPEEVNKALPFNEATVKKAENPFAFDEISTGRRLTGELKVKAAAAFIDGLLKDGNEKLVIFFHHDSVLKGLIHELGHYASVVLTGKTPRHIRTQAVDRFQNDPECRLFFGSIGAAGVGITLTAASTCVFVEASWVPAENKQAIERLHRIGQKNAVLAYFLTHQKSLDEYMLKRNLEKNKIIKKIMMD